MPLREGAYLLLYQSYQRSISVPFLFWKCDHEGPTRWIEERSSASLDTVAIDARDDATRSPRQALVHSSGVYTIYNWRPRPVRLVGHIHSPPTTAAKETYHRYDVVIALIRESEVNPTEYYFSYRILALFWPPSWKRGYNLVYSSYSMVILL